MPCGRSTGLLQPPYFLMLCEAHDTSLWHPIHPPTSGGWPLGLTRPSPPVAPDRCRCFIDWVRHGAALSLLTLLASLFFYCSIHLILFHPITLRPPKRNHPHPTPQKNHPITHKKKKKSPIHPFPPLFPQDEASWMGVYVTCGGVFMALLASRFSDLLFGYMKLTIICLMVVATAGYTWFLLLMNQCLPFSKGERETGSSNYPVHFSFYNVLWLTFNS